MVRLRQGVARTADPRVNSVRDALGTFFKPIKTNDPLLDFYTAYNKEASEFDVEYVKKYDEDLNTTLIFVRHLCSMRSRQWFNDLTLPCRRAYSLLLVRPLSSNNFNQIPAINRQLSSVPSSSPSTILRSQMKSSSFQPFKRTLPARSLSSIAFCMRAF